MCWLWFSHTWLMVQKSPKKMTTTWDVWSTRRENKWDNLPTSTNQPSSPGRCWRILTPCWGPKAPKTRSPRRWMHSAPRKPKKKKIVPKQKQSSRFLSARKLHVGKNQGANNKSPWQKLFGWFLFVFGRGPVIAWFLKNCHCGCESLHWILWMVDCHGWMFFDGCVSALKRENIIWWFVPWRPWINLPFEYPFVPSRCQVVTFCRHSFYWKWLKNARNASWRQHE